MSSTSKAVRESDAPVRGKAHSEDPSTIFAMEIVKAALDKKALEPVLLDVRSLASYTDYIVILSGRSDRHVKAVSDSIASTFKAAGKRILGSEGSSNGQWSLIDFGDVVVHVFFHPMREFYDLEALWMDAKKVDLEIPTEARVRDDDYF